VKPSTILLTLFVIFSCTSLNAQQLTNTTGATIKNDHLVLEYSVGEIAISTLTTSGKDATQGLLQPNIKVTNPDCDIISGELKFFENATKDKLRIVGIHDWIKSYQVYAADGRLIRYENYYNNYINVSGLPAAGIYFVRLLPGCNGQYKVLKFMKR
jgi:hypothetical protein